jgi:hypothetical protein
MLKLFPEKIGPDLRPTSQLSVSASRTIPPNLGTVIRGYRSQQAHRSWIGGHFTEPNEQNTQQSPGFERSIAPQFVHA